MDGEGLVMATGVMWGGGTPSQWQKESGSGFPSPEKNMNFSLEMVCFGAF